MNRSSGNDRGRDADSFRLDICPLRLDCESEGSTADRVDLLLEETVLSGRSDAEEAEDWCL